MLRRQTVRLNENSERLTIKNKIGQWKEHSNLTTERGLTSMASVCACRPLMAAAFFLLAAERVASHSPFQVNITANKNEGKSRRKLLLFIFSHFLFFTFHWKSVPLAPPKVLTFGKTQIYLVILSLNRTFALVIIYCTRENGFEGFFYR